MTYWQQMGEWMVGEREERPETDDETDEGEGDE